ncbi:transthyretin domain-containing protein [Microthyrium microscopicum]|uniref:5-hydroxyisourate hydrolase n=1 Tax=Microthyrium microscopicum TaxID=703497 RepID=A0A6A6TV28_9PEZI|nr:transthyretin domain-containing protein [Microthyrium microscopicum]
MATRPPVTCHVLDTTIGQPGPNIAVTLKVNIAESADQDAKLAGEFSGLTNGDGRVTEWKGSGSDVQTLFESASGDMWCTLTFETREYWEKKDIKPFFPEVEIHFQTTGYKGLAQGASQPHWHVPVLLGPYNYTTYRGS